MKNNKILHITTIHKNNDIRIYSLNLKYDNNLITIYFSDGSELTCTKYHKFYIQNKYPQKNRKLDILKFFGGIQGVLKSSTEDLTRVPNISDKLATIIYHYLHK